MINRLKRWIGRTAQIYNTEPVPGPISHGSPIIQVYKISNGYVVYRSNGQYRNDVSGTVSYCATPLDVARQIVNSEALDKMGIGTEQQDLFTTGSATAKFSNKI